MATAEVVQANKQEVILKRIMPQKPRTSIDEQIEHIVDVALRGNRGSSWGWELISKDNKEAVEKGQWVGIAKLAFDKTSGRKSNSDVAYKQWNTIQDFIAKAGSSTKFNKYPWQIVSTETSEVKPDIKEEKIPDVHDIFCPDEILDINSLKEKFPTQLLNASDAEIEAHPGFKGIYGRGAQVRSVLSSLNAFILSNGERANHTLLYGLPACAKSAILAGIVRIFGEGAVLKLDSTNTTRAGLEKLIFKSLIHVPPIFICEEIEKGNEDTLRMWLGAMDDRHEFRKVNFQTCQVRKVNFIALATANDKERFDLMLGGRPGYPGAISSRFSHQYPCPRPNEVQMRMILKRDIERFGGDLAWVDPCIALSAQVKTDDPRRVLGFLDGGKRLMDSSYQKDILSMSV